MPHSKALRCRNADKWQSRACFPVRRSAGGCFADRCFAARLSADRYFADRCFASVACRQGRKLSGKHPRSGAGQHDKWPRSGYANPAIAIFPPRLFLRHYSAATILLRSFFHHSSYDYAPSLFGGGGDFYSYFLAMAPTRDSKIFTPSSPPSSGSAARSGWGIMPRTFLPGLQIPAMFSSEPLGFESFVIPPSGLE